jgi:hypothetical protein
MMELIFLNKELENPNSPFMALDLKILFTNLEDFVYILTTKEWDNWIGMQNLLNEVLISAKDHHSRTNILRSFGTNNSANPSSILSLLYVYVNGSKKYRMLCLTPEELGDCYAIFFSTKEQLSQKSEEVKRKIQETRRENQSNPISLN